MNKAAQPPRTHGDQLCGDPRCFGGVIWRIVVGSWGVAYALELCPRCKAKSETKQADQAKITDDQEGAP